VDDTGIGIPKEKRELGFEDYVQVKEGQGGTGLGLGIVQSFVSSIYISIVEFHFSDIYNSLMYQFS
jgi:signal transduction histidine kinase